jgi:hypothetical protein
LATTTRPRSSSCSTGSEKSRAKGRWTPYVAPPLSPLSATLTQVCPQYLLQEGEYEEAIEARDKDDGEESPEALAEKNKKMMNETYQRVALRGARSGSFLLPHNEADLAADINRAAMAKEKEEEHHKLQVEFDKLRTDMEIIQIENKQLKKQASETGGSTVVDGFRSPGGGGGAGPGFLTSPTSPFVISKNIEEYASTLPAVSTQWTDDDVSYWMVGKMPYIAPRYIWAFRYGWRGGRG